MRVINSPIFFSVLQIVRKTKNRSASSRSLRVINMEEVYGEQPRLYPGHRYPTEDAPSVISRRPPWERERATSIALFYFNLPLCPLFFFHYPAAASFARQNKTADDSIKPSVGRLISSSRLAVVYATANSTEPPMRPLRSRRLPSS
jgi:hypothetical protein